MSKKVKKEEAAAADVAPKKVKKEEGADVDVAPKKSKKVEEAAVVGVLVDEKVGQKYATPAPGNGGRALIQYHSGI
jgi:hypothetical protein